MTSIAGIISGAWNTVANVFGWMLQRDKEKNSPEMIANQKKANEQKALDKVRKDIANGDIDAVRRDNS